MKQLRDFIKMRYNNDGTRTLIESLMIPEFIEVINQLKHQNIKGVLIGGIGLSYHAIPRMTQDIDMLFLSDNEIPKEITGFKRIRTHAFQDNKYHIEVEVLTPEFLKISTALVQQVINTSIESNGIKIASIQGLIALKLGRLAMRDKADIISLIKTGNVTNLTQYNLSEDKIKAFEQLVQDAKTDPHPS